MKRELGTILLVVAMLLVIFTIPVQAAKPAGNLASAQKVAWNLSADVMPVPPYGSLDIPGSDTVSKLIVNQPNGNTVVTITGAMNGLKPNTTYRVFLANGYEPYVFTGWNVEGTWEINVHFSGTDYPETLILTQDETAITGVSLDTIPPGSFFTVYDGSVIGNEVNIYANKGSLVVHMQGTIAADGSMSGGWADVTPGTRTGTWASTSGNAVDHTGDTGYPGLFTDTVQPFTFTTDDLGAGSWHVNLKDADLPAGTEFSLSVWINNGTILISDTFTITKG